MLLKFFRETKAYTSIFLCLVLLPMVTYSSMIIDASRLQSARVQVQSAGDLAMNAAMSEYEQVLEDMYGLFANASSKDDIEPVIRQYFEETISGKLVNPDKGYVGEFANALTEYAMSAGETGEPVEYTNFLQMRFPEEEEGNSHFVFSPVLDSDIANPKIMKGQIIDYMKYKGPVSVGQNFLNKLGFLKDMKNQSNAAQGKVYLAEKIADVNKTEDGKSDPPMKIAYDKINDYNTKADEYNGISPKPFDKNVMQDNLDNMSKIMILEEGIKKIQKGIPELDTKAIIDMVTESTSGLMDINDSGTGNLELSDKWKKWYNITYHYDVSETTEDIEVESEEEGTDGEKVKETKTQKVVTVTLTKTQSENTEMLNQKISNLSSKASAIETNTPAAGADVEKYKTFYNAQKDGVALLKSEFEDLKRYTAYLNKFQKQFCVDIDSGNRNPKFQEYENDFKNNHPDVKITVDGSGESATLTFLDGTVDDADVYDYVGKFKEYRILSALNEKLSEWGYTGEYSRLHDVAGNSAGYDSAERNYFEKAILDSGFRKYCDVVINIVKNLDEANVQLTLIAQRANEVKSEASSLKSSINEGENKVEDDVARSQMTSDIETLANSVNPSEVEALNKVVSEYLTRFKEIQAKLKEIKYFDIILCDYIGIVNEDARKITDEGRYSTFKIALKFAEKVNKIDNVPDIDATELWNQILVDDRHKGYDFLDDADFKAKKITGTPEEEKFYNVLQNTTEVKKPSMDEAESTELNNIKELSQVDGGKPSSEKADNCQVKDDKGEPSEPEKKEEGDYKAGSEENFGTAHDEVKSGESSGYGSAGSVSVVSGEDDAKNNAKSNAENGKNQLAQANDMLGIIANLGERLKDNIYLEEYFTEMFTCQTDKKVKENELTLLNGYTNNPENPKFLNMKNAWYGKEMEYILWGNRDLGANLAATETTIFLLRFAINAVYAFTASDIQSMASSIATALVGWTVVLVPVVQVCIVLAVALAESALDLSMLKDGKDVPLIKDSTTFICSPSGAINKAIDYGVEVGTEFVSDKVSEGIDVLTDTANQTIEEKTNQVNDIVKDYVEQQRKSIESTVRDNFTTPLVNTIHPVLSKLDDAKNNVDTVVDTAIDEAWGSIKNNIDNLQNETVKKVALVLYNHADIGSLKSGIKGKIPKDAVPSSGDIEEAIKDKVDSWLKLGDVQKAINDKLDSVSNSLKEKLTGYVNDGATNLKEKANEAVEEAGNNLSGKAKDTVKEHIKNSDTIGAKSKSIAAKVTMNYKEYCKLFMFMGLCTGNEDKMMQRAAALMQVNVNYAVRGNDDGKPENVLDFNDDGTPKKAFYVNEAYTMFYVSADIEMGTLFPWAIKIDADETDASISPDFSKLGGNTVNLHYSGMTGY